MDNDGFDFEVIQSGKIKEYVPLIADFRIRAFRSFPYLYVGNLEYESTYLNGYISNSDARLVVARKNNEIAGLVTGMPLKGEAEIVQNIPTTNTDKMYYLGEFITEEKYRHQGLAHRLSTAIEEEAKKLGYSEFSILTVLRNANDPRMPKGWTSSDRLWQDLGFEATDTVIEFEWPTILENQSVQSILNPMKFWVKY